MAISKERRSSVSVCDLAYAPLITDSAEELEYGTVVPIPKAFIGSSYTPNMNNAQQYASGIQYDSYTAKGGGELELQIPALSAEDQVGLFGCQVTDSDLVASGKDDIIPDVMVIYSTENSKGKINLYKFPKCKFTDQGESVETKNENGITYQAQTLSANYSALLNNGKELYTIRGLDPVADAALITEWFATAKGGLGLT